MASIGAALAALALAGCGPRSENYDASGTVKRLDAPARQITIAHGEIRGFMPAMTMNFDVAPGVPLDQVHPGDRVRFRLERSETRLRIISLALQGEAGESGGLGEVEEEEEREDGEDDLAPLRTEAAPEIRLTDQDGRPFALSSLRGSAVLLDFIFTHCTGPCPILTSSRVRLQQRLGDSLRGKVHFVSVSIDPGRDTPERLREYARAQGADLAIWSFLTGTPEAVEGVLRAYHVGRLRDPDGGINHTVVTYLIDTRGRIRRPYLGLEVPPDQLLADLTEALS
jgi:protein SCO1/2